MCGTTRGQKDGMLSQSEILFWAQRSLREPGSGKREASVNRVVAGFVRFAWGTLPGGQWLAVDGRSLAHSASSYIPHSTHARCILF